MFVESRIFCGRLEFNLQTKKKSDENMRLAACSILTIFTITLSLLTGTSSQRLNASMIFLRIPLPGLEFMYWNGSKIALGTSGSQKGFRRVWSLNWRTCSWSAHQTGSLTSTLRRLSYCNILEFFRWKSTVHPSVTGLSASFSTESTKASVQI